MEVERAQEDGVGFAVSLRPDASRTVRQVFEITGLIPAMPVLSSVDEAAGLMAPEPTGSHEGPG